MKRWHETGEVVRRALEAMQAGAGAAIATVIRVEGSAYRRPGAKLIVGPDGALFGGVSGGCLEADVREHAIRAIEKGTPSKILEYHTGPDDPWGLGLGCDGSIDVLLQTTSPVIQYAYQQLDRKLRHHEVSHVITVVDGPDGLGTTHLRDEPFGSGVSTGVRAACTRAGERPDLGDGLFEEGEYRLFGETLRPPPRVLICGAGDDAIPLAVAAARVGFRVLVADHRERLLTPERLPGVETAVVEDPSSGLPTSPEFAVVMTHSLAHDRAWLHELLRSSVTYIGMLGPRERTERMAEELSAERDGRVYGPVGLSLGAEGPEQVALSVVAEMLAVYRGTVPDHLRDRSGPIHG